MLYYQASPKAMMMTSCVIVIVTGLAVFFVVTKGLLVEKIKSLHVLLS